MNETQVTLTGWMSSEVTLRSVGASTVASFRLGSTPRRLNRQTQEWSDAETQWYTVSAWRTLGDNCAASLHCGDPVVVHGRLSARTWKNVEGNMVTTYDVDATFVGHDLNRGTTTFAKPQRPAAASPIATGDPFAGPSAAQTDPEAVVAA